MKIIVISDLEVLSQISDYSWSKRLVEEVILVRHELKFIAFSDLIV